MAGPDSPRDSTAPQQRTGWIAAYADASWHTESGKGGWALWIRTDGQRIVRWGPTPAKVRNSLQAEAAAVFAAVCEASRYFPQVRGMTVKTDCQAVVHAYQRGTSDPVLQGWTARMHAMAKDAGIQLRLAWVKGHQRKNSGTPGYLNNRVDEYAREARLTQKGGSWREAVEATR